MSGVQHVSLHAEAAGWLFQHGGGQQGGGCGAPPRPILHRVMPICCEMYFMINSSNS